MHGKVEDAAFTHIHGSDGIGKALGAHQTLMYFGVVNTFQTSSTEASKVLVIAIDLSLRSIILF